MNAAHHAAASPAWLRIKGPLVRAASKREYGILVAEFVIDLGINLPWIVPVKPTERQTVVDQQMPVCDVQRCDREREVVAEGLAGAQIQLCMPG